MKIPKEELLAILSKFNPWWRGEKISDLPDWSRSCFGQLMNWIEKPPVHRAILISGQRQVGKTTLILQAIQKLIQSGVSPANILYATFDHPVCKLAGLEAVLEAWRELEPKAMGFEYVFLDEAQFVETIGTWVKHNVDFSKSRRIIFTGSATPLLQADQESGVGRWHTLHVATLSFYEYLHIKKIELPHIPILPSLHQLLQYNTAELFRLSEMATFLIGHFHEFLIRGGFPQTVLIESITQAQKLLREDILEKVLGRDMTALFGVRRIFELEQMFIFLCMHDGGLLDLGTISKELGIAKPTVQNFINLFQSTHLIYKLHPFGYGKEILRGKNKIYLSDPAIASSMLMKGKSILEDAHALGQCVETAIAGHLYSYIASRQGRFSYWRNQKRQEIDLIVEIGERIVPFEVKYQSHLLHKRDIPGLIDFCNQKGDVKAGFIITKTPQDIGPIESSKTFIRIPACLFCYYIGYSLELLEESDSKLF